jgi:hypothetical protein
VFATDPPKHLLARGSPVKHMTFLAIALEWLSI